MLLITRADARALPFADGCVQTCVTCGTVARVALRLGRRAMGCDLNPAYLELADARTVVTLGLPFAADDETEREAHV